MEKHEGEERQEINVLLQLMKVNYGLEKKCCGRRCEKYKIVSTRKEKPFSRYWRKNMRERRKKDREKV